MVGESRGHFASLPVDRAQRVNVACDKFEAAWDAGGGPAIELYIAEVPTADRAVLFRELLGIELEIRRAAGDRPNPDEYRRRFPAHAGAVDAAFGATAAHAPGRVLETIAASAGPLTRVLLPETRGGDGEGPPLRPHSPEMPPPADRVDRFHLLGEMARGGMGAVLRGHDPNLGRDLAVKVLLDVHRDNPELVRRFVEEAQIGGQLQHPGIVPVYELGAFSDRRPYFAMKLVKGRTLAALLQVRQGTADLPRFLSIFEAVCQTLAYAHARGVIHRDLKPSNVMVGDFGEVQVMDWGLAKVLQEGGVADDERAGRAQPDVPASVVRTVRSGSAADASHAGSVLGTPAYMPPEQAGGDIEAVDRRADVFGLGAILCEVLTGKPPYAGRTPGEILRRAARGDLADAFARLGAGGADPELADLARACLAAEPADRPSDAGAVAARLGAHLAGVQERLRKAERQSAVAEATAVGERKRRKLQVGMVTSVLALTIVGGLSFTYQLQQRQARAATTAKLLGEAATLRNHALAQPDDRARWQSALASVRQAEGAVGRHDPVALRQLATLRDEVRAGAAAAERDRTLRDRLVDVRSARADDRDGSASEAAYSDAFREAGLDMTTLSPEAAGEKIRARPSAVALALAAGLDDWSAVRRNYRRDPTGARRLAEAADKADPDPWRHDLRSALSQTDPAKRKTALQDLARSAKFDDLGAISLDLLGGALGQAGDRAGAVAVLRGAQRRHPGDVWVNYDLAQVLEQLGRRTDAIRYYTAARSIRPETAHELAHVLERSGETDEAIAVFQDLVRLQPGNGRHLGCLGITLRTNGRSQESARILEAAVAAHREAIRLQPDHANAHARFGFALLAQEKLVEAVAEYREAIRLQPDYAWAHASLGNALREQGRLDGAVAEYREAIRLNPDDVGTHVALGNALREQGKPDEAAAECREAIRLQPDYAWAHVALGDALSSQGKLDEAGAAYREAIRLQPDHANAHNNLANVLNSQGKLVESVAEYREAIRLQPDHAIAHANLGNALLAQERPDEAAAECREALRLQPNYAGAHKSLGAALHSQGKLDEAVVAQREAIRLQPDYVEAHFNLGRVLRSQGDYRGSLTMYRKAQELSSKQPDLKYPSASWVAEAERLADLADRLPALLKGDDRPRDAAERLAFAQLCYDTKRHAAAARLWAEALAADPKLGDDRQTQHRYNAACAAALAVAGQCRDDPNPDEATRAALRRQALGWLKAELAAWSGVIGTGDARARTQAIGALTHWTGDPDLAGVRDPEALAKLPGPEREGWRSFWADVEARIKRPLHGDPRQPAPTAGELPTDPFAY